MIYLRRNNRSNRNRRNFINVDDTKKLTTGLFKLIIVLSVAFFIVVIFNITKNWINYKNIINTANKEFNTTNSSENVSSDANSNAEPSDTTFTLTALGDIMCHNTQYLDAYNSSTDSYNFSYVFDDISYYIQNSNIAIANLETSFAGEDNGYSNYPRFNTPDSLAYNLKKLGLDVIATANSHSLDYGFEGLSRTLDILESADISHVGTNKTQEEQDNVLIKYIKGIKLAFVNYTCNTTNLAISSDKEFCINTSNKDLIKKQIDKAKSQNADIIIAYMNWGNEYTTSVNSIQTELSDFLFKNGVDIILGSHPHVLQKMEKKTVTLEDGSSKDGFIIYSLGNFISDQNLKDTRTSIILTLTITKHTTGNISIDKVNYVPIYMYENNALDDKKMKLLDINKTVSLYNQGIDTSIGDNMFKFLTSELNRIPEVLYY